MEILDRRTYSDLVVIFEMMSPNILKKINPKLVKLIIENASNEFKSDIKPYIPLKEQKLSSETEAFLGLIYINYFNECIENKDITIDLVKDLKKEVNLVDNDNLKTQLLDIRSKNGFKLFFEKIKRYLKKWF